MSQFTACIQSLVYSITAEDSEGMWCMNRDSIYPEDLAPLPSGFTPATTEPTPNDSIPNAVPHLLCIVILLIFYKYCNEV